MHSAQKGFLSVLIILTTVLAIGATAFLIFVSNPGLTSKINPSKTENTSSKYPNSTTSTSTNTPNTSPTTSSNINPQKNAFQLLKDKILPPESNTSQANPASPAPIPTINPGNPQPASKTLSPTSTPTSSSAPVSPNEDIPTYYR